ncbi:hypothetical protein J2Z19_001885 [Ensifer adhaerens]|uniref:Uncharacterized protein n=1 Tax=Ensifer adhaerens TaxID=106592 RepID=A0ACC5STF8_ENSAD|nr:hypothetical protein [Ensifer adhaerens]
MGAEMTDEPSFQHLNDLPKRNKSHDTEGVAQAAFET